ncbi:uncharacterized protein EKO05_0006169 [Ascochyta rabiei]|uniref:Uncharacterized protein n=1 Tax=Didymella rabiei TaxID=5454 RepID=A0A163B0H9_DIDRA|nr:uncharacterized protein EKO05_0006169 [Ascochyta rabiei]KZM21502.1 hypothetical protein ST47_g7451 [Ascochyta rabiei]UPX15729.1 hypothetical protein EKO05_0006169 [Ascochyta rabiei]
MGKITGYDSHASTQVPRTHSGVDDTQKNVLQESLLQHSSRGMYPMASKSIPPSVFKPGFCDAQTPIAAELTQSFLNFASKSGGINLKQMGVRPGQRWCVEATRWQETLKHEKEAGVEVPLVKLECTHESALKTVELDILKRYAAA